tara:strand:- start:368 stop:679 length:312 start_codon:yes stop_codon:yes gene_type:complete
LKRYIPISVLALLVISFITFRHSSLENDSIKVVLNVENLDNQTTLNEIKKDINLTDGVEFVNASLTGNTVILKINKNHSQKLIQNIFDNNDVGINEIDIIINN